MNRKNKRWFNFEALIVVIIAGLMIFLIHYVDIKFNEIQRAEQEMLPMKHTSEDVAHIDELSEIMAEFRPGSYKMIEVYDSNFELITRLHFDEDDNCSKYEPLASYPELIEIFNNYQRGHTTIEVDDYIKDVYFFWSSSTTHDEEIVIIYIDYPIVQDLWIFSFVCYLILILIFILLIVITIKRYKDHIERYHKLSEEVQEKIFK